MVSHTVDPKYFEPFSRHTSYVIRLLDLVIDLEYVHDLYVDVDVVDPLAEGQVKLVVVPAMF